MIKYKIDVIEALKRAGYNTTKIRTEKLIGERNLTQIRRGEPVSWLVVNRLCSLLHCQPGDLFIFEED